MSERPRVRVASVDCSGDMPMNIYGWRVAGGALAALLLTQEPLVGQHQCPASADSVLKSGWRAYRADSSARAVEQFTLAHQLCPRNLDAVTGLGFTRLRQGLVRDADSLFTLVLERDSTSPDAWEGRARASARKGDTVRAVSAGRRAIALAPANQDLRSFLNRISPDWERAAPYRRLRPANLQLVARTQGQRFEISTPAGWRAFYIKGVNLGVALPGHYPSEFPTDSSLYAGWLDTLAAMSANTLRLYTIFPPSFYRALRAWNLAHPDRTLWLIHGVWTELPPRHDFDDPGWKSQFQAEMRRVIDLVHGSVTILGRPGHAGGRYDADVSRWVLAYILGREWEPFAVKAYDSRNPAGAYSGRFLKAARAPAMERWLAQQCDLMLRYEVDSYNAIRPIAYTNWPTLDPLRHPTEANTAEEAVWRRRSGRRARYQRLEYENDAIGLDANLIQPTPANPAGWFASYHAYPYYPDFMLLDPGYRRARSSEGPSSYFGYLRELVTHHAVMPTVIAEYGVPSSRGIAHLHPQGWSHGGHDERAMAAIDARLTREIRGAGAAGSVVFAWLDEWFKKNWAVMDYEIPSDNTRLWHNLMDAEQNYGILGQYAGAAATRPRLGGDPEGWRALPLIQTAARGQPGNLRAIRAGADESFLYLAMELSPEGIEWDSAGVEIAIDTYLPEIGQHLLPRSQIRSGLGFEFLVDLSSTREASLRVIPDYNRHDARLDSASGDDFGRFSRRPVITRNRGDGRFDSLAIITNRARFGRDGTFYGARGYDRGRLLHGTEAQSTLSDWYFDRKAGLLQLRLAWDLLNVTDPSTRTLLFDPRTEGSFGTVKAGDFHFGAVLYQKGARHPVLGTVPERDDGEWSAERFRPWRWREWTEPRSHGRLKPVYDSLRAVWQEALAEAPAPPERRAPSN